VPTTYRHAAMTYLNEWLESDYFAMRDIADQAKSRQALVQFARDYGVIRCFKTERDEGDERLSHAHRLLFEQTGPYDRAQAIQMVGEFDSQLKAVYQCDHLSAASKFLWLRFQSPVILYDSLAWTWIARQVAPRKLTTYEEYCSVWLEEFRSREEQLRAACDSLRAVRDFCYPSLLEKAEIDDAIASTWFVERVFDNFICNDNGQVRPGLSEM
jgi:hypothetical protein